MNVEQIDAAMKELVAVAALSSPAGESDDAFTRRCMRAAYDSGVYAGQAKSHVAGSAVATVHVGQHEHGPFIFKETPYGTDKLTNGFHSLYAAPVEAAEPVAWLANGGAGWRREEAPEILGAKSLNADSGAWTCNRCGFIGFWEGGPHDCENQMIGVHMTAGKD